MAGTPQGALKSAARRVGISVDAYLDRISRGLSYCWRCSNWHPSSDFNKDSSRWNGLETSCRASISAARKAAYRPHPRQAAGRRIADAREQDGRQARARVRYLVKAGVLPDSNDLPCSDCGHVNDPGERRHEYDHYHGYDAQHHECAEAVCVTCHRSREKARRLAKQKAAAKGPVSA
jgi:hypothetical protein